MKKYITGKAYQAIVQIRPKDEKLLNFVKSEVEKENAEVTDMFERKEGMDVLISSSRAAFGLSKKFKKRFGGETKITRSLIGENKLKGKLIYRLTVLLRLKKEEDL
jgi:NMD protein affecting ribosome stability and mRNA decay